MAGSKLVDVVGSQVGFPTASTSTLPTAQQIADFLNEGLRFLIIHLTPDALFDLTQEEEVTDDAGVGSFALPTTSLMGKLLENGILINIGHASGSRVWVVPGIGKVSEQEAYGDSESLQYADSENPMIWFADGKTFYKPITASSAIKYQFLELPAGDFIDTTTTLSASGVAQFLEDMAIDYAVYKSRLTQDDQQEADAALNKLISAMMNVEKQYSGLHGL